MYTFEVTFLDRATTRMSLSAIELRKHGKD
jgi:hypothetical protein